uniref:Uncharacterized protein n=1 Tax=Physcomitrium patens TaxID=3218 RepID=A0A2K1IDD3_PHYPA|nr:hypothetical protein PHYPA_029440 [Physcomitrium patens]
MRQMDSHRTVGRDGLYMGLSFDKIPGMIFQDGLVFQGHGISLARIKLSLFEGESFFAFINAPDEDVFEFSWNEIMV